jgi:hypothetical protein
MKPYQEIPGVSRPRPLGIPSLADLEFTSEDIAQILEHVDELDARLDRAAKLFQEPL